MHTIFAVCAMIVCKNGRVSGALDEKFKMTMTKLKLVRNS